MTVTDEQVATLRAYLAGNFEEYDRLFERLDQKRPGYRALVTAAFCEAVERRFAGTSGTADSVVDFVGSVRARSEELAAEIDPRTAERMIQAVYTDEEVGNVDGQTVVNTQFLLLAGLIVDEQLDAEKLDGALASARKLADQWI